MLEAALDGVASKLKSIRTNHDQITSPLSIGFSSSQKEPNVGSATVSKRSSRVLMTDATGSRLGPQRLSLLQRSIKQLHCRCVSARDNCSSGTGRNSDLGQR